MHDEAGVLSVYVRVCVCVCVHRATYTFLDVNESRDL